MATRTALLNGNVINRDADFSKHIEAVSEPGVINGLTVSSSSVAIGEAFVKCERTNGDVIYALVYNTSAQSISGDGDVYIEVSQEIIDNGELGNEDGSEIAEIKVGTLPDKNALWLATISSGVVTDKRNMIKTSGELNTAIGGLDTRLTEAEADIQELQEAGAINHLEESGLVGELYALTDKLCIQTTPTLANSVLDGQVGQADANKQVHIQRLGSGTASNKLKLKVKSVGSPTTGLVVEVRKGVQVTVTENVEAYWYGGEVIASGSIAYSDISNTYAEKEITLDANFGGTKGELLDVVVYQTGSIVNASNYYCIALDETQYSEGLSYVKVNGTTRAREKIIPYCNSAGFVDKQLGKKGTTYLGKSMTPTQIATIDEIKGGANAKSQTWRATTSGSFSMSFGIAASSNGVFHIYVNGTEVASTGVSDGSNYTLTFSCDEGDYITFSIDSVSSGYYCGTYTNGSRTTPLLQTLVRIYNTGKDLFPQEVVNIGSLGVATLYGENVDGKYYGGIITGTSTQVETGSITLGNAVGYLVIDYNGTKVKVPYYNN